MSNAHMNSEVQELARKSAKFISWQYSAFAEFFKNTNVEAAANNKKSASFWWSVSGWDSVPPQFIEQAEIKLHYWLAKWDERLHGKLNKNSESRSGGLLELLRVTQRETIKADIADLEIKMKAVATLVAQLGAAIEASADSVNSYATLAHYEGPETKPHDVPDGRSRSTYEEEEDTNSSGPLFPQQD